jgi:hypothetical protein
MTCEHLVALEQALIAAGFRETSRGQAWSQNCREWVYFDCYLPAQLVREKFGLAECVEDHMHRGTHDGQESGFVCSVHHDGIMGHHPDAGVKAEIFRPE